MNFENIISKLIQFEKNEDHSRNINWHTENEKFEIPDLNLSMSSNAMSSFLHDFDITKG